MVDTGRRQSRQGLSPRRSSRASVSGPRESIVQPNNTVRAKEVFSHECLRTCQLFKGRDPQFVDRVVQELHVEVFQKGEFIFREGDAGETLCILRRGDVEVLSGADLHRVCTLSDGSLFGEQGLLGISKVRNATIRALDFCDCRVVHQRAFLRILKMFPGEKQFFAELAKERKEAMELQKAKEKEQARKVLEVATAFRTGHRPSTLHIRRLEHEVNHGGAPKARTRLQSVVYAAMAGKGLAEQGAHAEQPKTTAEEEAKMEAARQLVRGVQSYSDLSSLPLSMVSSPKSGDQGKPMGLGALVEEGDEDEEEEIDDKNHKGSCQRLRSPDTIISHSSCGSSLADGHDDSDTESDDSSTQASVTHRSSFNPLKLLVKPVLPARKRSKTKTLLTQAKAAKVMELAASAKSTKSRRPLPHLRGSAPQLELLSSDSEGSLGSRPFSAWAEQPTTPTSPPTRPPSGDVVLPPVSKCSPTNRLDFGKMVISAPALDLVQTAALQYVSAGRATTF